MLLQGDVLTVDGVVQGGSNSPPPDIDPETAQQALDATSATSDVTANGGDQHRRDLGDLGGDAAGAQQNQIETITNNGISDNSCL